LSVAPRRLGMFGGAFDPPHRAHVALAEAAVAQLRLDQLRIFPTGQAWHKARALTASAHRVAMARLAFEPLDRVVVDERETRREGATYTIDTLRELHAEFPAAQLHLLMGEDQAAAFTQWREWQAIAELAIICVASRPDAASPASLPPGVRLRRLDLPAMPESATAVRARLTAGQDVSQLVPPGVASYIAQHHLYRSA
jgi:nicotinate-nucleotide adenylyltransferase